jgi:hypothetical protein
MQNIYATKTAARLYGIFFITTFLAYGIGSGLVASVVDAPDFLSNIAANQTQIVIGVILMAIVHTAMNIGLATIMLPILKVYNKTIAYGYFAAAIAATVTLTIGAVFILLLLPLGAELTKVGSGDVSYFETLGSVLKSGNFYAYQIGMAIWGLGGLLFCYLLYISKLVPRFLPVWGFVGYSSNDTLDTGLSNDNGVRVDSIFSASTDYVF